MSLASVYMIQINLEVSTTVSLILKLNATKTPCTDESYKSSSVHSNQTPFLQENSINTFENSTKS